MYLLKDVIEILEEIAPPNLAESWDNVGVMLGSKNQKVNKVLCALDINEAVVQEAICSAADCIVTHHPLFFKPLYCIDFDTPKGQWIKTLICHNIAVYAMHTNFDIAAGGINDFLCECIGIKQTQVLQVTHVEPLVKLVVYVPETHYEAVRRVMIDYNTYQIGHYGGCSFTGKGEGTFMPLKGSNPFIGNEGLLEKVHERKIECVVCKQDIPSILSAVKKVHPYEEVAYDTYLVNHLTRSFGIGRYGQLKETMAFSDFIQYIKEVFGLSYIRVTASKVQKVKRVAVCSGSGSAYIKRASQVADVYITADIKFHEAQEAHALGLCVVDVGHYLSENKAMGYLATQIGSRLKGLSIMSSTVDAEMIQIK